MWVTEYGTGVSKIAKITTTGTITEYTLPNEAHPGGITKGPDGNLWFAEEGTSKIGKITTAGAITEYGLPSGSVPREIAVGPEGNLWFTEYGTSKLGEIPSSWKSPYADSSKFGYEQNTNGAITYPQAGPITGSTAAQFDGTSGYLTSANTAAGNTNRPDREVTLKAWINPSVVNNANYKEIISKTYVANST